MGWRILLFSLALPTQQETPFRDVKSHQFKEITLTELHCWDKAWFRFATSIIQIWHLAQAISSIEHTTLCLLAIPVWADKKDSTQTPFRRPTSR